MELILLTAMFALLLLITFIENKRHQHFIRKIPVRIHVNGTRGKSSIARLLAAGLRQSGLKVICKTTGSEAKLVLDDKNELPILRGATPNIIEQCKVAEYASKAGADVLVIECMALKPELQAYSELKLIRSTHGVITNCGPDHLDVMGPTELDVALALAGTVPVNGLLYTNEKQHLNVLEHAAADRKSIMVTIPAAQTVSDDEMAQFSYIEHKENVALALKLCADLGVERKVALAGMVNSTPDLGAMDVKSVVRQGHEFSLVNAFAANDPASSKLCWHQSVQRQSDCDQKVLLVNCREDRHERSTQLAAMSATLTDVDKIIVIGTGRTRFVKTALASGIDKDFMILPAIQTPLALLDTFAELAARQLLIVGIGNIKDSATHLLSFFEQYDSFTETAEDQPFIPSIQTLEPATNG
ncbi:MAG: poly-gamma-glutamate synthase PgsB [Algicola sp.]|nr:poly-gamma-glutamate synthase PgsB [Algicola sp.]